MGGMRPAFESVGAQCIFSSDWGRIVVTTSLNEVACKIDPWGPTHSKPANVWGTHDGAD